MLGHGNQPMYQVAVFIHLASAIIWIGGSLFLALVLIPALRKFMPPPGQPSPDETPGAAASDAVPTLPPDLLGTVARRFRLISWVCIVLLVTTGLYILPTRYGIGFAEFFTLGGHFVSVLQLKVGLVAIVIWLSVIHDFIIGPYTSRLIEHVRAGGAPPGYFTLLRRSVVWVARINLLLTILIVVVAVTMTRGTPV